MTRAPIALLTGLALVAAGCGSSSPAERSTTTAVAAASSPALDRCVPAAKAVTAPSDLFPAGLLPAPSRVFAADAGAGTAAADVALPLRDTLLAIRAAAVRLGLTLGGQDYEGVEAELELGGSGEEIQLQLKPAPKCTGVTQVTAHH